MLKPVLSLHLLINRANNTATRFTASRICDFTKKDGPKESFCTEGEMQRYRVD